MTPELTGAGWRVFRDPAGVPHVQAEGTDSLAAGHGAVTAHDRAWHLEVLRRRAEGRSAELLGPEHLDADHLSVALEVEFTAWRWWEAAAAADRQFLAAYAHGVNAHLPHAWARSPEVHALGLQGTEPEPWQPWTPLAVHVDTHLMSGSLPEQVWRHRVRSTLGERWVTVLDAETPRGNGSNAWLVPADLSVSGAPLIAADPHRVVEESGPYQPVCFSAPGLRVRGLALVGLPGVPHFGRTESAAWAVTAAMMTTEDLSEVTVERRGGRLVVARTGERLSERSVTLHATSGASENRWVRRCPAGLVLPGDTAAEMHLRDLPEGGRAQVLAVRQVSSHAPSRAVSACRELLSAQSTEDVRAAWSGWAVPVNDVVAADRTGACLHTVAGHHMTAHGPEASHTAGVTPLPPGCLIRANQRPHDPRASALRLGCAPPHRARRARDLVEQAVAERGAVSHEDLLAAQGDTRLAEWPAILERLLSTTTATRHDARGEVSRAAPADDAQRVRDRLLSWDGSMAANSSTAALFARWRDSFTQELARAEALRPLLGPSGLPDLWEPFINPHARVGLALSSMVAHGPSVGLDPRDAAMRALHHVAAADVAATEPEWGQLHAFTAHRAHTDLPPHPSIPVGGDTDCLLSTGTIPGWGPACVRVPAARVLWDLADPAASWWITPDPVDRGTLGRAPVHRWAAGEMDQALPWVPAGGFSATDVPVPLGRLSDGLAMVGRTPASTEGPTSYMTAVADGALSLRPVDANRDAALIHSWVREERARFWGMTHLTVEQVEDLYAFIASTPTHHAWLIHLDDTPLGVFQTYEPHADVTGAHYRVDPGDLGIHVLLAPVRRRVSGMTNAISTLIHRELLRQGRTRRIVVEPDVGNDLARARVEALGFTLGPAIELPHKTAQLALLTLR